MLKNGGVLRERLRHDVLRERLGHGVLRERLGHKKEDITGYWRKMHNKALHDLFSSTNTTICVIRLRR
jgi:hypothetical protein